MSKSSITHQDFFVIRTPRSPINQFFSLGVSAEQTREVIYRWLEKPEVQEALYLASPSLLARYNSHQGKLIALTKSTEDECSEHATKALTEKQKKAEVKQTKKLEQSLLKYMLRMCARPTPFGLFSGIHQGRISNETQLLTHDLLKDSRKTRLDIFYLSALKEHFLKANARTEKLKYYPNASHYFVANQCRYIEAYQSNETRQYRLSAVEKDEYFCFVLSQAKGGISFDKLVSAFISHYSVSADNVTTLSSVSCNETLLLTPEVNNDEVLERTEVEEYLQELIDEAILVADIALPLTGDAPDSAFIRSLNEIGEQETADHLSTALHQLQQFDAKELSKASDYQSVLSLLNELPVKPEENKLFQTDVYRSFEQCQLDSKVTEKLREKLLLLHSLQTPVNSIFSDFITKFNQRFEGQFVPLDLLLDEESGIGFSNETGYEAPLLAGLHLQSNRGGNSVSKPLSILDNAINRAITLPSNRNKKTITLTSKVLKEKLNKSASVSELPASFAAMISLFEKTGINVTSTKSSQDAEKEFLIKFNGCYGPSSANLLGRFCHLDEQLKADVANQLTKESEHSPDVIFAEIVHMPEGRPGNVIARPHLRQYEIVFLADSTLESEYQIPISDLYVWVEGQQVKLWSKRLKKQVIPRLSCAHNYSSRSLSAYKFLCMLQHPGNSTPGFSLPQSQVHSCFVPRVMLDNLILSERVWRIERALLVDLLDINKSGDNTINAKKWNQLLEEYQIEEQVTYARGDNILQLNLLNPMMLEVLLVETQGQTQVELKESLNQQYTTPVKSSSGDSYANELIIPFFNKGAKVHQHSHDNPQANIESKSISRRFSPGSEWLSLKIYSGNTAIDNLLAESLLPLINENLSLFEKWFFIRYGDPQWHLRLRFFGKPEVLYGVLLPKLNALIEPMIAVGELHKAELFTYEREVERYGGPESMALVESLFMTDSQLISETVQFELAHEEEIRWRVALLMTDKLLTAFDYSSKQKLDFISRLRTGFGQEFNESSHLRKQLGNKYKNVEQQLRADFNFDLETNQLAKEALNNGSEEALNNYSEEKLSQLLQHWYKASLPAIEKLLSLINSEQGLKCSKDTLLSSILHMHNNRLFKAYGREHELVMHDFLRRYYFSTGKRA
jgi:thiopeptide-type bacteriocin biosynthesis protein